MNEVLVSMGSVKIPQEFRTSEKFRWKNKNGTKFCPILSKILDFAEISGNKKWTEILANISPTVYFSYVSHRIGFYNVMMERTKETLNVSKFRKTRNERGRMVVTIPFDKNRYR